MSEPRLAGKVALVTGSSRGLGRAVAEGLAEEGAAVVVTYQSRKAAAEAVAAGLRDRGASDVLVAPLEVTERASIDDLREAVAARFGRLDVLVNNAGVNAPADFDAIDEASWDRVLGVNLKGPFLVTQAFMGLLEQGGGSVIMIGSVSGQYGGPRTAHYAASKAGLISLAQVVARFGASRGVRCNTLAAGLIASDMAAAGLAAPAVRKAAEGIPLGRLGTPAEVARAVAFLASDDSSYVTGQVLNVNGGLYF